MTSTKYSPEIELAIATDIAEFYADPLGYVMYAFEWGKPGGDLEYCTGPDKWQREQLQRVGQAFEDNPDTTIQEAIASGHGIGKSAETAWIIMWAMSTRPHLSGVVTANTATQLASKTWRELAVWNKRAINEHWFKWTATRFFHVDHPDTWVMAAIPQSEHGSEAFAGLHADHVLVIYDEASAIPDIIWEVSEGAMTTPRAMWFVFGNPTKNTGRFRECFGKNKHRWNQRQVDSRTCKMTNKAKIQEWLEDHGEDSDFFRVRVRGEFPRAGSQQFISSEHVENARRRTLTGEQFWHLPVVLGVDVARFGADQSVIIVRQGRKIKSIYKYRELSTVQLAARVAEKMRSYNPTVTFVDGIGVGAGVVDQLVSLGYPVQDVNVGQAASEPDIYYNKRAECWGRMRDWLEFADIPDDSELADDLVGPEYKYTVKEQIQLEKKEDMKKRGLSSPDAADAIAITFAEHVITQRQESFDPDFA